MIRMDIRTDASIAHKVATREVLRAPDLPQPNEVVTTGAKPESPLIGRLINLVTRRGNREISQEDRAKMRNDLDEIFHEVKYNRVGDHDGLLNFWRRVCSEYYRAEGMKEVLKIPAEFLQANAIVGEKKGRIMKVLGNISETDAHDLREFFIHEIVSPQKNGHGYEYSWDTSPAGDKTLDRVLKLISAMDPEGFIFAVQNDRNDRVPNSKVSIKINQENAEKFGDYIEDLLKVAEMAADLDIVVNFHRSNRKALEGIEGALHSIRETAHSVHRKVDIIGKTPNLTENDVNKLASLFIDIDSFSKARFPRDGGIGTTRLITEILGGLKDLANTQPQEFNKPQTIQKYLEGRNFGIEQQKLLHDLIEIVLTHLDSSHQIFGNDEQQTVNARALQTVNRAALNTFNADIDRMISTYQKQIETYRQQHSAPTVSAVQ